MAIKDNWSERGVEEWVGVECNQGIYANGIFKIGEFTDISITKQNIVGNIAGFFKVNYQAWVTDKNICRGLP